MDPSIFPIQLELAAKCENPGHVHPNVEKCLLSLLRIALGCSMESLKDRMSMIDVIRELNLIKCFFPFGI